MKNYLEIQNLLRNKSELESRLKLLPYDGTPEVKTINKEKYIYIRKRVLDKVKSTYVDVYSDDLFNLLVRNNKTARELKKQIKENIREFRKNVKFDYKTINKEFKDRFSRVSYI